MTFAILGAALPSQGAAQSNDYRVVPGERIGPIRLGMSASAVYSIAGEPRSSVNYGRSRSTNSFYVDYLFREFSLQMQDDSVLAVWVHTDHFNAASYHTDGGIRIGSSDLAVRATLGRPYSTGQVITLNNGAQSQRLQYRSGLRLTLVDGLVGNMLVNPAVR